MSRPRIAAPQLTALALADLRPGDHDDLEPNTDLDGVAYADLRGDALDLGGGSLIAGSSFDGVLVDELGLASSRIRESRFAQVATPVLKLARSNLMDVEFTGGRLGAVEAYELRAKALRVAGVKINYLNLRGAELTDVAFTDCTIDDLDLSGAKATRMRFRDCRIDTLNVRDARLTNVDLRDSQLGSVGAPFALTGAVLSEQQVVDLAPALAREIGIVVA